MAATPFSFIYLCSGVARSDMIAIVFTFISSFSTWCDSLCFCFGSAWILHFSVFFIFCLSAKYGSVRFRSGFIHLSKFSIFYISGFAGFLHLIYFSQNSSKRSPEFGGGGGLAKQPKSDRICSNRQNSTQIWWNMMKVYKKSWRTAGRPTGVPGATDWRGSIQGGL